MLYIKDMNLVEILILSQSETKGKSNAFHHKGESQGSVHKMCVMGVHPGGEPRKNPEARGPPGSVE